METQRTKPVAFGAGYITALAHVTGNDVRIKPANNPEACTVEVINADGRVIARYGVLDMSGYISIWAQHEDTDAWPYASQIERACEEAGHRWAKIEGTHAHPYHTGTFADHHPPALAPAHTRTRARTHV
jgi:hypothetical protein